jgi:2'-5' RNA ligase
VAVELPPGVRSALNRWALEAAGNLAGLRALAADSLHVTLCFLGWRPEVEIDAISEACAAAAVCPRFAVSLAVAAWLPERRPRVLAVALEDPERSLAGLRSRVARSLEDGGFYKRESRPFLAHVTVARARRNHRIRAQQLPSPAPVSFPVEAIVLMRSHPERSAVRYEPLASFALEPGRPQRSPSI